MTIIIVVVWKCHEIQLFISIQQFKIKTDKNGKGLDPDLQQLGRVKIRLATERDMEARKKLFCYNKATRSFRIVSYHEKVRVPQEKEKLKLKENNKKLEAQLLEQQALLSKTEERAYALQQERRDYLKVLDKQNADLLKMKKEMKENMEDQEKRSEVLEKAHKVGPNQQYFSGAAPRTLFSNTFCSLLQHTRKRG